LISSFYFYIGSLGFISVVEVVFWDIGGAVVGDKGSAM
jgi:hypothetical protein